MLKNLESWHISTERIPVDQIVKILRNHRLGKESTLEEQEELKNNVHIS